MVNRASPFEASFRAYHSGGTRSVIEKCDDTKLMQEHSGNFMKGESRKGVESPQNYGFVSHVHEADKDKDGNVEMGAESFVSFMGGNRSFPVYGATDDRRHRLHTLEEGDTAFHRGKDDRQQMHMTKDGTFLTARNDRKHRMALVDPPQDDQQQQQGQQGGAGGQSGQGGQDQGKKKPTGQKAAKDDNLKSSVAFEQNGKETFSQHGQSFSSVRGGSDSTNYYQDRKKSTQATQDHSHLRTSDNRIFTDEQGCWSETPIQVKKDRYCKE